MSKPHILMDPDVGFNIPANILSVDVLSAPSGFGKPVIDPLLTVRLIPATVVTLL